MDLPKRDSKRDISNLPITHFLTCLRVPYFGQPDFLTRRVIRPCFCFLSDLPGLKFDLVPQGIEDSELNGSPQLHELPIFDKTLTTNISVQLGGSAFLYCKVKNAKDLRVSHHGQYTVSYTSICHSQIRYSNNGPLYV